MIRNNIIILLVFVVLIIVSSFSINGGKEVKLISNRDEINNITVNYHNKEIVIDKEELLDILEKYSSKKVNTHYIPYDSSNIIFEIDFDEEHKPKQARINMVNTLRISYQVIRKGKESYS